MGKSYIRKYKKPEEYDPKYDSRTEKKEKFANCQKHGQLLAVKKGAKWVQSPCLDEWDIEAKKLNNQRNSKRKFNQQQIKAEVDDL